MSIRKPNYQSYLDERKRWEKKGYVLDKKIKKSEYNKLYADVKDSGSNNVVRDIVSAETWVSREQAKAIQGKLIELRKTDPEKYREVSKLFINSGGKKNTYKITQKDILRVNIYSKEFRDAFAKGMGDKNHPASDTFIQHGEAHSARQQAFFTMWDMLGKEATEESYGY